MPADKQRNNRRGSKGRGGRPSKLTPARIERLASLLEAGNFFEQACRLADVSPSTAYSWLARGRDEEAAAAAAAEEEAEEEAEAGVEAPMPKPSLFRRFAEAVELAEARVEDRALSGILAAGERDWRALAWFLEHRFPVHWGRVSRVTATATIEEGPAEPLLLLLTVQERQVAADELAAWRSEKQALLRDDPTAQLHAPPG